MTDSSLFVTKSLLPPLAEYQEYIRQIFESCQLTNRGPLENRLEQCLCDYLGVKYIRLTSNGTLALMLAIRQAGLSGKKVITTPFTYVATVSALLWEGCTPLFADIDPHTFCLDPHALEETLTLHPDAAGVFPVHVYGNACDVESIDAVCREHDLKCVYDAAHAFGARYKGRALPDFGDYAVCSFHAAKLFHCVEGGCVISHSEADDREIDRLRAFGHEGDEHFSLGMNAKLSEPHAAMGLAILPYLEANISLRREISQLYERHLPLDELFLPTLVSGLEYHYIYFPVVFTSESALLAVKAALEQAGIYPRRYFYPSLTSLPYLPKESKECTCPVADGLAPRVLCLPLSHAVNEEQVRQIASIIRETLHSMRHGA